MVELLSFCVVYYSLSIAYLRLTKRFETLQLSWISITRSCIQTTVSALYLSVGNTRKSSRWKRSESRMRSCKHYFFHVVQWELSTRWLIPFSLKHRRPYLYLRHQGIIGNVFTPATHVSDRRLCVTLVISPCMCDICRSKITTTNYFLGEWFILSWVHQRIGWSRNIQLYMQNWRKHIQIMRYNTRWRIEGSMNEVLSEASTEHWMEDWMEHV